MLKILQISNYMYPNIGGIEQVARDIAQSIATVDGYEQKIICFNETASDDGYVCNRQETVHDIVDGIEVIRCGCFTKKASQSLSLTFGKELKNVMESFEPDVVIFHYPNPFEAYYLLKYQECNFKLILYWHLDIVKQKILGKVFHYQTLKLLNRADVIVATSPLYIDGSSYLSKYRSKCVIIPNCIDEKRLEITDGIREKTMKIRQGNPNKIICFGIGRHISYKGFSYLIEASKYLDERFQIFIGGKGELTDKLIKQAADDKKIVFLGRISNEDTIAYYLAMDIFCFPSITKNEAFGIALAEAMYFGKPAVTFNISGSGVNYVCINGETGIEVENRNVKAYAEAIKKLADDAELRQKYGNVARRHVLKNFTYKIFENNILELIKNWRCSKI